METSSPIQSHLKSSTRTVSEGNLVELTGFLIGLPNRPGASGAESVNCRLSGMSNSDFHIPMGLNADDSEFEGIVVEMIPQDRNAGWTTKKLKRAAREKQEAIKFANEALLRKLIPVLDHFDMALSAAQSAHAVQSLQSGIQMVYQQLKGALLESGLEELDATGKPFDPNLHEAVSQKETAEAPEGQVVQQLRKGYKLRDRLLRPAAVIVAKAPAV